MVKWLIHSPFTAVTRVQFPLTVPTRIKAEPPDEMIEAESLLSVYVICTRYRRIIYLPYARVVNKMNGCDPHMGAGVKSSVICKFRGLDREIVLCSNDRVIRSSI